MRGTWFKLSSMPENWEPIDENDAEKIEVGHQGVVRSLVRKYFFHSFHCMVRSTLTNLRLFEQNLTMDVQIWILVFRSSACKFKCNGIYR